VLDTELQARFARSCTDAAFGYARAATAAYAAVATQTFEFWAKAASPPSPAPSMPNIWTSATRRGADQSAALPFGGWPNPALEFFKLPNPWTAGGQGSVAAQMAFAPVAAWWGMFPLSGNPASWPLAYVLMTAGVPSAVAWPTAEANTAAIDAAEAATDALNKVFASYRTDSGYAMAQVIGPRQIMTAMMLAPLGASMTFPWSSAARASGF
jgi:hypothetical protein